MPTGMQPSKTAFFFSQEGVLLYVMVGRSVLLAPIPVMA